MIKEQKPKNNDAIQPKRRLDIVIEALGDETLLYSAEGKAIHVLNATAKLIWELCDGENSLADMEQAVRAGFSVPDEHDVQGDVQQTIDIFSAKGLLQ